MRYISIKCVALLLVVVMSSVNARTPAYRGTQDKLPSGFFIYGMKDGLYISDLNKFTKAKVPNVEADPRSIAISDDGNWIIYLTALVSNDVSPKCYIIRKDGSQKTLIPNSNYLMCCGFVNNGPFGSEVFLGTSTVVTRDDDQIVMVANKVTGIQVDLTGQTPKLGASRTIVEEIPQNTSMQLPWQWFVVHHEQGLSISKNHLFGSIRNPIMIMISDQGKGTAQMSSQIPTFGGFNCGIDMSQDGSIIAQNVNFALSEKNIAVDNPMGHRGPTLFKFSESGRFDAKAQVVSTNWVLPEYEDQTKNDWHFWEFTNKNEYIIGVNQGKRDVTLSGYVYEETSATPGVGIWMLHAPTNTWTLLTPEGVRSKWMAAYISGVPSFTMHKPTVNHSDDQPGKGLLFYGRNTVAEKLFTGNRAFYTIDGRNIVGSEMINSGLTNRGSKIVITVKKQ